MRTRQRKRLAVWITLLAMTVTCAAMAGEIQPLRLDLMDIGWMLPVFGSNAEPSEQSIDSPDFQEGGQIIIDESFSAIWAIWSVEGPAEAKAAAPAVKQPEQPQPEYTLPEYTFPEYKQPEYKQQEYKLPEYTFPGYTETHPLESRQPAIYTITFTYFNGRVERSFTVQVPENELIPEPTMAPVAEGQTFVYWYDASWDWGKEREMFNFNKAPSRDMVLKAHFVPNTADAIEAAETFEKPVWLTQPINEMAQSDAAIWELFTNKWNTQPEAAPPESEPEYKAEPEPERKRNPERRPEPERNPEAELLSAPEWKLEPERQWRVELEFKQESEWWPVMENGPRLELESMPAAEQGPKPENGLETDTAPDPEIDLKGEVNPMPEPEGQPKQETKPELEVRTEPGDETDSGDETGRKADPEAETKTDPADVDEANPKTDPEGGAIPDPIDGTGPKTDPTDEIDPESDPDVTGIEDDTDTDDTDIEDIDTEIEEFEEEEAEEEEEATPEDEEIGVTIQSSAGEYVEYGETIDLNAKLTGLDGAEYVATWYYSEDGSKWNIVKSGLALDLQYMLTEENVGGKWAVEIIYRKIVYFKQEFPG